jgi:hypothetical protein
MRACLQQFWQEYWPYQAGGIADVAVTVDGTTTVFSKANIMAVLSFPT